MNADEIREMEALATRGPAFPALEQAGAVDWPAWVRGAEQLYREWPDGPSRARRIHHLTIPILLWLANARTRVSGRPLVAGLSAPQGAGKSTLGRHLIRLLADFGLRATTISIDDFYLPHVDQERLAARHAGNPYLRYRGYPGTHDLALGTTTLEALRSITADGEVVVPAYDKSLHGGRGDRLPRENWPTARGPLDLVLVEGWMLGFRPVEPAAILDPELRLVNGRLRDYDAWHRLIDVMVILKTTDIADVLRWRIEAEDAVRASGRVGLERAAIEDYVRRFTPAYETYGDTVETGRWSPDRQLVLQLGGDRLPVTAKHHGPRFHP